MTQPSFEYLERERVLTDGTNKYPVITPTEQWEREVRGRKDLKEGVEFTIANQRISSSTWATSNPYAIPILPVQEEVKGGDESPFQKRYRELYNQASRNGSAEEREYLRNIVLDELGEAYKNHPVIKYLRRIQKTQYKDYPILWNQVTRIVNDIIELNLLNSDQNPERSVASKAK